ncbi:hypothetical protein [Arcticibacter tournemirensis]|uniref:DUF4328 domain-containing protein n=1 Tax=Arcticibacter tournemirensis TaxID=699437 RepID=A0A4Q0MEN7_9SPHI|nr:hypothetical protein [Arcticibacter tournemirensis]RXF71907.1 hypothetical protein EKH83_04275 [Arcticibacter tournemirensis]
MPQDFAASGSLGLLAIIGLVFTALFCLTLYNTLILIKPENRKIKPVTVWLLFVPGFNIIWNFFVVLGLATSIKDELLSRDFEVTDKPGLISGIGYSVVSCLALIPYILEIPKDWFWALGVIGLLQLIFFVQYWMKVNWYKTILKRDSLGEEEA